MKINKAYKFRMCPTLEQQKQIKSMYGNDYRSYSLKQVGSNGKEAENFRCEPRDSDLFGFCPNTCYNY